MGYVLPIHALFRNGVTSRTAPFAPRPGTETWMARMTNAKQFLKLPPAQANLTTAVATPQEVPLIHGLSHITFMVRDLDRMQEILMSVFDARKVYDSGDQPFSVSRERFFLIGQEEDPVWVATMEGQPLPTRTYNHVAFRMSDAEYDERLSRVRRLGLDVREARPRVPGEGRSIYFHDDDNHLFELHTGTLPERLLRYAQGR